jgi:hypothetical protein
MVRGGAYKTMVSRDVFCMTAQARKNESLYQDVDPDERKRQPHELEAESAGIRLFRIQHPAPAWRALKKRMKKNRSGNNGGLAIDQSLEGIDRMKLYCTANPRSPSAVRRPQLLLRSELWVALLGPSVEEGIVGIGPTVEEALQEFDIQYLAGLHPPADLSGRN